MHRTSKNFVNIWNAKYLGGFVVHSKAFDGLNGNFPIRFLVWNTAIKEEITSIDVSALNKNAEPVGEKRFNNIANDEMLSWMPRTKKNKIEVIPLINAVTPTTKTEHVRNTTWANDAIGHFFCNGNDLQNSSTMTAIFSSVHSIGHAGGYFITNTNLWQVGVVFSVRRLIATWLNDRDQFLQPTRRRQMNSRMTV